VIGSDKVPRLALACQLHKIPSSVYDPTASAKTWNADGSWPLLGPPKDQWDLCERIHALYVKTDSSRTEADSS